jgi:predicted HicB family RNase H-like nuclease
MSTVPGDRRSNHHGTHADGGPVTDADADLEAMADEAEQGYDVETILQRRRGRPTLGTAPASVESVRLDPGLKRDLLLRAAQEGVSVSEVIRAAVRQYLQAN